MKILFCVWHLQWSKLPSESFVRHSTNISVHSYTWAHVECISERTHCAETFKKARLQMVVINLRTRRLLHFFETLFFHQQIKMKSAKYIHFTNQMCQFWPRPLFLSHSLCSTVTENFSFSQHMNAGTLPCTHLTKINYYKCCRGSVIVLVQQCLCHN